MSNTELIETARQAMKDLSATNMLEHEQTAYNCLRLLCEKAEKAEALIAVLDASKTEHELPNDYGFEYNRGFVSAINSVLTRLNSIVSA